MKKVLIVFILFFVCLWGNPIDPTQYYINEIFVTDSSWIIEMPIEFIINEYMYINHINDTITISNKSDSILYPVKKMVFFDDYCCIYSDSIESSFQIDPNGDVISMFIKDTSEYFDHSELEIGNTKTPEIIPKSSLCLDNMITYPEYSIKYYTDLSPTIGTCNDSTDACGEVTVTLWDNSNNFIPGYHIHPIGMFPDDSIYGPTKIKYLATYNTVYFKVNGCAIKYQDIKIENDSTYTLDITFPIKYTEIDEDEYNLISQYKLDQNFPNPFNPTTTFGYYLPERSHINLNVYNMRGELVENLISEIMDSGQYYKIWNASQYPSGVYIYQLKSGSVTLQEKCLFVK